jgi:hypothetical protein
MNHEEHEDHESIFSLEYVVSGFSRTGTSQHRRLMSREAPICSAEKRSQSPDDERLVDGQVTIDTDGQHVQVRTYVGGKT